MSCNQYDFADAGDMFDAGALPSTWFEDEESDIFSSLLGGNVDALQYSLDKDSEKQLPSAKE